MITMETTTTTDTQVQDDDSNPTYDLGVVDGAIWVYELVSDFILADELGADVHDLHAYVDYRLRVRLGDIGG